MLIKKLWVTPEIKNEQRSDHWVSERHREIRKLSE